jgi:hypothetical protein
LILSFDFLPASAGLNLLGITFSIAHDVGLDDAEPVSGGASE